MPPPLRGAVLCLSALASFARDNPVAGDLIALASASGSANVTLTSTDGAAVWWALDATAASASLWRRERGRVVRDAPPRARGRRPPRRALEHHAPATRHVLLPQRRRGVWSVDRPPVRRRRLRRRRGDARRARVGHGRVRARRRGRRARERGRSRAPVGRRRGRLARLERASRSSREPTGLVGEGQELRARCCAGKKRRERE